MVLTRAVARRNRSSWSRLPTELAAMILAYACELPPESVDLISRKAYDMLENMNDDSDVLDMLEELDDTRTSQRSGRDAILRSWQTVSSQWAQEIRRHLYRSIRIDGPSVVFRMLRHAEDEANGLLALPFCRLVRKLSIEEIEISCAINIENALGTLLGHLQLLERLEVQDTEGLYTTSSIFLKSVSALPHLNDLELQVWGSSEDPTPLDLSLLFLSASHLPALRTLQLGFTGLSPTLPLPSDLSPITHFILQGSERTRVSPQLLSNIFASLSSITSLDLEFLDYNSPSNISDVVSTLAHQLIGLTIRGSPCSGAHDADDDEAAAAAANSELIASIVKIPMPCLERLAIESDKVPNDFIAFLTEYARMPSLLQLRITTVYSYIPLEELRVFIGSDACPRLGYLYIEALWPERHICQTGVRELLVKWCAAKRLELVLTQGMLREWEARGDANGP